MKSRFPKPQALRASVQNTYSKKNVSRDTQGYQEGLRDESLVFPSAHVITKRTTNMNCVDLVGRLSLHQNGVLTIRGALPEDAGNYTCLATNDAGTASQSVSLTFAGESRYRHRREVDVANVKTCSSWKDLF